MTDRRATGAGGPDAGAAIVARGDLGFLALMLPIGAAIGVVNTFSVADEHDGRLRIWEPATWELSSVVVISLLAPAVMALTRRVWPLGRPRWRVAVVHLAGLLAFALAHVLAAGALRWAVYAGLGERYDPFGLLFDFIYELRKDALIYVAVVAAYVIWRRYVVQPAGATGPAAAPPDPGSPAIEVRDGARRHFVPLAELAFIEAAGNYVELHRGATPILHRAPLSEMERLLKDQGFVRIHRSRLVRRAAVAEVESKPSGDYVVRLVDGRELAGSRRYRRPLLEP